VGLGPLGLLLLGFLLEKVELGMLLLVLRLAVRALGFGSILFLPIVFSTKVEEDIARASGVGRIGTVFFAMEFGSLSRVVVGRGLRLLPGFLGTLNFVIGGVIV
jgi:hypothetical protein